MKKTAYILAAAVLIAALSGCNSNSGDNDKPAETTKVTQVAFEVIDTTPAAINFLKTLVQLFSKYLETRMQYPLSFETETETENGMITAGIYIKDESAICFSSTDASGMNSRNIYMDGKIYMIFDEDKVIYEKDTTNDIIKNVVEENLLKININDATAMTYKTSNEPVYYNDVLYKHEAIYSTPDTGTNYYYDVNTDDLVYIVYGDSVAKVIRLNNEVSENAFTIPQGYEIKDMEEYFAKIKAEQAAQTTAAE